MTPNYCYDIHHNLAIDYTNKQVSVGACCQSGRFETNIENPTVDQLWNIAELKKIRIDNLNGKLSNTFCESCTKLEEVGNKSRRHASEEFYQGWNSNNKICRGLDIKLGNLCNLKCTICGPHYSTSWIPDAKKMGMVISKNDYYNKDYNKQLNLSVNDPDIIKNLEMIKFWGGEPLINETHADILEMLDRLNVLKNCRVVYNTNGTYRVSERVLELWKKANLVELYFSIDDVGARFDYQRYGASWSLVEENVQWYKDKLSSNHLFYIMCTVSYLNLLYLDELYAWKKQNFDTNRMGDFVQICLQPAVSRCSVENIPENFKEHLLNKFQDNKELINFLNFCQTGKQHCQLQFVNYVSKLDSIRTTNWKAVFPELFQILND
jgi:organic radical activating enzyme